MKRYYRYFDSLQLFIFLSCAAYAQQSDVTGSDVHKDLVRAAMEQVGVTILYTPGYVKLSYPGGDLPLDRGVCTDVVIRAFRKIGVDLQKEIHEDMRGHFSEYPQLWELKGPDKNIDHRRVPNLMTYFVRKGKAIDGDENFQPGDIVTWRLSNNLYHIGIVSEESVPDEDRYFIIHNIGEGVKKEDILLQFKTIGQYRW